MTKDQYRRECNIIGSGMTNFWKHQYLRIGKKYPSLSKRDIDKIIENTVKFFIING